MNGPVVVGVDDMEHSRQALDVAVREARMRRVPLWLVHAYQWIPPVAFGVSAGIEAEEAVRGAAEDLLGTVVERIHAEHPGLPVETVPVGGPAAQVLVEACPDAALLVVGSRGSGGFGGLMLGSVALRTVSHTHLPVMVVRGEADTGTGQVLVGLDVADPASGPELLEFAFREAALRGIAVHAVHVGDDIRNRYLTVGGEYVNEEFDYQVAEREKRLDALLAPWTAKYPAVPVSRQLFAGSPARVLVESSRLADLVVLGGRVRTGGHEGLRVGALGHTVLHHAHCPVVIVPEH